MSNLTPARIAEDAIGMFLERLSNLEDSGWADLDGDAITTAKYQAIQETEGYEVILPHEVQRVEAASELLAVCKAVVEDEDIAQGYGGLYAHLGKLRELARAAIAKAEALPPAPSQRPITQRACRSELPNATMQMPGQGNHETPSSVARL